MDFFADAIVDLEHALSEALRVRYPLLVHLTNLERALRVTDAESFEEAARRAILRTFNWDTKQRGADIDRFITSLQSAWPDRATQIARMKQLCDHAKSALPSWARDLSTNEHDHAA